MRVSPQVYPLADFPLREISLASQRGVAQHSAATLASRARVLQQVSGPGRGRVWDQEGAPRSHKGGSLCLGLLPEKAGREDAGESQSEEHEVEWVPSWGQCGPGSKRDRSVVTGSPW